MTCIWSTNAWRHSHNTRSALLALLAVSVLISAGCKKKYPTLEEMKEANRQEMTPILAKHRTAATAKIEAIRAAAKDAKNAEPVTQRQPAVSMLAPKGEDDPESVGLLLANLEWAEPDSTNTAKVVYKTSLPLSMLERALKEGHAYETGYSPSGVDEKFALLNGLKQAAFIRVHSYTPPKYVFAAGQQRFEAGSAAGDVLVYDLETGKRVGAFPFVAGQRGTAHITKKSDEEIKKELEWNFGLDFNRAVRNEVIAFATGKSGPAAPGVAADTSLRRFADRIRQEVGTEYLLSGPKSVQIEDVDGEVVVTIKAETPSQLATKSGIVIPGVNAIVEKVLGRKATVKVLKADE